MDRPRLPPRQEHLRHRGSKGSRRCGRHRSPQELLEFMLDEALADADPAGEALYATTPGDFCPASSRT